MTPNEAEIEHYTSLARRAREAFKVCLEAYVEAGRIPKTRRPVNPRPQILDAASTVAEIPT